MAIFSPCRGFANAKWTVLSCCTMPFMKGMPKASPLGLPAASRLSGGSFGPVVLAKAHPAFAPPPSGCTDQSQLPSECVDLAQTWPPPRAGWQPAAHGNPFASLNGRVRGMAKQWRDKIRSPPKGAAKGGAGCDENVEPATPRLHMGVKPFGKDGVRLGWQRAFVNEGETLHIEWQAAGSDSWTEHSEVEARTSGSGTHVVKHVPSQQVLAPSKRAWRVRSSAGDASSPAKVGDKAETRRQRTSRRGAAPTSAASAAAVAAAPTELPTTEEGLLALVRGRRDEVDCLLRVDLSSGEGIAWASRTVAESLALDAELDQLALSHHVLKGKLFQGLIEALRAAGCGHAQFENSVKHIGGNMATDLGLSLVHWSRLTLHADAMRNLVRIKVADDNDLRTCREGLLLCDDFFRALQRLAELRGVSEHAVLQALDAAP